MEQEIDNNSKISKINQLQKQISDLEYAINIFVPEANITRGNGIKDINSVIKLEHKTRLSIFGSRWFGIGTHRKEIELPSPMVGDIQKMMECRCNLLRAELNVLLNKA